MQRADHDLGIDEILGATEGDETDLDHSKRAMVGRFVIARSARSGRRSNLSGWIAAPGLRRARDDKAGAAGTVRSFRGKAKRSRAGRDRFCETPAGATLLLLGGGL